MANLFSKAEKIFKIFVSPTDSSKDNFQSISYTEGQDGPPFIAVSQLVSNVFLISYIYFPYIDSIKWPGINVKRV